MGRLCGRVHLRTVKLRGFKSFVDPTELRLEPGVAVVVVVTENYDDVGGHRTFVHDPEAAGHPQQRMACEIDEKKKAQEEHQEQ